MAILILPIAFITLFFCVGISLNLATGKKELIISTTLIFSGLIVLITELLSLFDALNYKSVLLSWLIITVVNLLYLYQQKNKFEKFYSEVKRASNENYHKLKARKLYEKCLLFSVSMILLLIFIQGIIYPPNNWDSMNYHLGRIPSWISHQSVAHYPTGAIRQIYQPPFAEYVILHLNLLNRADYFSSSGQFFFLVFSIVTLVAIVETFGSGMREKILAIFLALTIPEVILQATSTQNDIAVAFFVIAAFYFAIKSVKEFSAKNAFFFGLAVGLGILTKGTAYVYMPALLLIYGITMFIRLISTKNYKYLLYSILAGLMFLSVNIGFYYRNYQLTSNLLGVDEKEYGTYSNEKMSAKLLLSSIIKNAGNHVGVLHLKPLSEFTASTIIKWHKMMDVDINDPANNYYKDKYNTLYNPDHEDAAPNFIHLILITAAIALIIIRTFKHKIPLNVKLLAFTIIFQGLLFSMYLKYQPFHTRLQTSIFLLAVPLICYAVTLLSNHVKKLFYWSTPFIFVYALMIAQGNLNHPLNAQLKKSRDEKYFMAKPWLFEEYSGISKKINALNLKNIGLILGDGDADFEYALFTKCYSTPINPIYINVDNYTNNSRHFAEKVECIVATSGNKPFIDYKGQRFYNQNPNNKLVFLYR